MLFRSLAKKIPVELNPEFIKELIYRDTVKEQEKDSREEQRQINKVSAMMEVANFGIDNWKELLLWDKTHSVLTPTEISFVNTAIAMERGKFPSERQCAVILKVLERARTEGFPK